MRKHSGSGIPDEYIVMLPERTPVNAVSGIANSLTATYGLRLETVWPNSVKGFACNGSANAIGLLAADPRVEYVEQTIHGTAPDGEANVSGQQGSWVNGNYMWHLDRLDELSYANRDASYWMCPEGRGIVAYVIDYGVYGGHSEFESPSRMVKSVDFTSDQPQALGPDTSNGCFGTANTW
ncbi:MAG TPA: hypothetical protein VGQ46_17735, partial [Thermoanaerobaculia bacterium]|nr:hypothetical protein [Thermoanaerobaculia bacterium]